MSKTELHRRKRTQKQHTVEAKEPEMTRKGLLAHPGSLGLGLAGALFVAYVFDAGGAQAKIDGLLGGLDYAAKSQSGEVAKYFIFILPVAAVLLGAGILYIVLSAAGRMVMGPVKEKRKKEAKAAAKRAQAEALAVAGIKPKPPEGRVLVRPARLNVKDRGITKIYPAKG